LNRRRFERLREVLARRQPDLTILMERVNKPHNFSAILRSCDAVGILDAHVVLPEKGLKLSNHTSAGAAKWVRVVEHPGIEAGVEQLKGEGFRILAAHPSSTALDFREVDLTRKVAIMVGAELEGLSGKALALADEGVFIPMAGMARSLNVSVATALLLFEAFRQRRGAGLYDESRLDPADFEERLFEWAHPELARVLKARKRPYPLLSSDGEPILEPGALQD
jgi:tRNA (guanosine-2'-O-)-methyltransferase